MRVGGIDVTPKTIEKFRNAKDEISAVLLEEILRVRITGISTVITHANTIAKVILMRYIRTSKHMLRRESNGSLSCANEWIRQR